MKNIAIRIEKNHYQFTYPDWFNELKPEQYIAVLKYFILNKNNFNKDYEAQIRLMYSLADEIDEKYKVKILSDIVKNDDAEMLLPLNDFLSTEQDFTVWILRTLKIGESIFHGPTNYFSSMKFGEFIAAEMLCNAYLETKRDDLLDNFIAVLYRPGKPDIIENFKGDCRIDSDSEMLDIYSQQINKYLSEEQKQGVLYNYIGIRNWITKKYIYVFPVQNNTRSQTDEGNDSWLSIRRHLAGNVLNLEKIDEL